MLTLRLEVQELACVRDKVEMRVIAYGSTSFGTADVNYSTIEKELTALRWGIKIFRPLLIGVEFIIYTDSTSYICIT